MLRIQIHNSEIFLDYSIVDSNKEIRSEFPDTMKSFASIYHQETKKGFFMLFKKPDTAKTTGKLKMVYIYPFEEEEGTDTEKFKNLLEIKKNISTFYLKSLSSDNKFWKFQLFDENAHTHILHWSEHLQENKYVLNDVYATMQKEGITFSDNNVKKKFNF